MKTASSAPLLIIVLVASLLLLSACMSAEERAANAQFSLATLTAAVAQSTSTEEAVQAARTSTAEANDLAVLRGELAKTAIAREEYSTATAAAAIVIATADARHTAEAAQLTAQAAGTATQVAKLTATEAAHVQQTANAKDTADAWDRYLTQKTLDAASTADAVAMQDHFSSQTATATAQAPLDAYTAGIREDEETLRDLGIQRAKNWNWLLGAAPYIVTTPVLILLILLAWRFGIIESNRRKQQPTGEIIDERNGQLTVLIPTKSYWPTLESPRDGARTTPAPVEAQAAFNAQTLVVEAVKALSASVHPLAPVARQMLDRLTAPNAAAPLTAGSQPTIRILTPGQDQIVDAWVEELETKHLTSESGS